MVHGYKDVFVPRLGSVPLCLRRHFPWGLRPGMAAEELDQLRFGPLQQIPVNDPSRCEEVLPHSFTNPIRNYQAESFT